MDFLQYGGVKVIKGSVLSKHSANRSMLSYGVLDNVSVWTRILYYVTDKKYAKKLTGYKQQYMINLKQHYQPKNFLAGETDASSKITFIYFQEDH